MADETSPRPAPPSGEGGYRPGMRPGARPPAPMGPGGRPLRRPGPRRRVCRVCQERKGHIDWKAVNFLRTFLTDRGKILSARAKGTCSKCQRKLTIAIKRARVMGLIPFTTV